jgi:DNA-3-methyladenine glycosylase I
MGGGLHAEGELQIDLTLGRCPWADPGIPELAGYHDLEWGVPIHDDATHFEFFVLEGAQAGLSWLTVLRKREGYREAFEGFDLERVASFGDGKIEELLGNPGIVRNRLKVRSAVNNARMLLAIAREFGSVDRYLWSFVGGRPKVNVVMSMADLPATSSESDAMSRDLKRRGLSFVGSTICYAHMQATGLVNDHTVDCFRRREIIASYPPRWRGRGGSRSEP